MSCQHFWTVTSECPRCLRELLDRALVELYKQVRVSRVVYDREICDMATALADKRQAEYEARLAAATT